MFNFHAFLLDQSGVKLVQFNQPNGRTNGSQIKKYGGTKPRIYQQSLLSKYGRRRYISESVSPFPLLGLFYGQSENAFKDQDDDGNGEIPKPRIIFDSHYSINGNETMCRKNKPGYDSFDGVYETHLKRLKTMRKREKALRAKAIFISAARNFSFSATLAAVGRLAVAVEEEEKTMTKRG